MPYEFTVIDSHLRLPQQKQEAAFTRLNEAISCSPWIQGEADLFRYEYRKHYGNLPLSFGAMVELWGWVPLFEQTTGDLVGLTSYRTETEDEEREQQFLGLLAPDLEDESFVEVEIDHLRRRYLSFRGKMYRLDATYVYSSLDSVIAQTASPPFAQSEPLLSKQKTPAMKLYACSVVAWKAVPTQFGWRQQLKNYALAHTSLASTPVEHLKEAVANAIRDRDRLDGTWQIDVALCEIPGEVLASVYESTIRWIEGNLDAEQQAG